MQVSWHREARRIAFGVATRATMGSLVSDDEMDDLCSMYDNIGVTSALVRQPARVAALMHVLNWPREHRCQRQWPDVSHCRQCEILHWRLQRLISPK